MNNPKSFYKYADKLYETKEYAMYEQQKEYLNEYVYDSNNFIEDIKKEFLSDLPKRFVTAWERGSCGNWQRRRRTKGSAIYDVLETITEKEYFHRKLAGTL